jgi:hypothetical protein
MTGRMPVLTGRLNQLGPLIAKRNHDGDQASIEVWSDSYAQSLSACRTLGVDDTLPTALMYNFQNATNSGYGDKEISAMFEVLLPKANGNAD